MSEASHHPATADPEKQPTTSTCHADSSKKVSAFKALGWLDRFLAVWIFLSMVVGILIGNFVPNVGQTFEKGQFVGVSVPIGASSLALLPIDALV